MPRRNRNARPQCLPDPLPFALVLDEFRTWYSNRTDAISNNQQSCAGCGHRGDWDGDYCPACKGRIIIDARTHVTRGR